MCSRWRSRLAANLERTSPSGNAAAASRTNGVVVKARKQPLQYDDDDDDLYDESSMIDQLMDLQKEKLILVPKITPNDEKLKVAKDMDPSEGRTGASVGNLKAGLGHLDFVEGGLKVSEGLKATEEVQTEALAVTREAADDQLILNLFDDLTYLANITARSDQGTAA